MLKIARQIKKINYKLISIWLSGNFSLQTWKSRKEFKGALKVCKEKKSAFIYEREIKVFSDKLMLSEFTTTRLV